MSASGQYLRLETTGRKSGKPHGVLVRFITVGGTIVIFPQNGGRQDWLANVRHTPRVRIYGAGVTLNGRCEIRTVSSLKDPLLGIFTRKYGINEVRKRYWGQLTYVEVEVESEATPQEYSELVYSDLEAAFDGVAESYDQHILGNQMNVWLRDRSINLLRKLFHPGEIVLEVGCGTGTETLHLARHGVKVLACDISSKMLAVLQEKSVEAGLSDMVIPIHARPYALGEEVRKLGYHAVAGAYSTYGAINTEPRLAELFRVLHSLVRTGGKLLLGVWNKYSLYEIFGYTLRMKPSMIAARWRNPVPVGKSRFCVTTTSFSVGSLSRFLAPYFRLERAYGVEILLPPSNLVSYLPPERILGAVKAIESRIESIFPWNRLGDHFLGVYDKIG